MFSNKEYHCMECGAEEVPKKETPGYFILELFLWCMIFVPGMIYSVWRVSARKNVCPVCRSPRIITLKQHRIIEARKKLNESKPA